MKGQWEKIFRMETGSYKPKWITKWREKQVKKIAGATYGATDILPDIQFKESKSSQAERNRIRKKALASLSSY